MSKKISTEIRAAIALIVTEDLTALRAIFKNVTNSVSKSSGKYQEAIWQNKKRP
jgi:hypothetical protein